MITHNGKIVKFNDLIISQFVSSPITPVVSDLKLLILGDSNVAAVGTQISNEVIALGYNTPTITTQILGTTYDGNNINTTDFNVVLYWTNSGQQGSTNLYNNLVTFTNNGGGLVTGTFVWNIRPSNFNFNLTPFVGPVNQSSNSTGNMTIVNAHPIVSDVNTSITNGSTILNNLITTLQTDSILIGTYSNGTPYLSVKTMNNARLVGINGYFGSGLSTRPNLRRLLTNSVLWGAKILN